MKMSFVQNCSTSDTDDSEYCSCDSDMENEDFLLTSDAVDTILSPILCQQLTINAVQDLDLELYEKISLVYLLYEDPHTALQQIILLRQNAQIDVISEWSCYEKKTNKKWAAKLLEALAIIQNYAVLKKLGFKRADIEVIYTPLQDTTLYVNVVRKCCYRVCEDFIREDRNKLILHVEKDFANQNASYIPKDQKQHYNSDYLEMYFLFLETEKYISLNNIKNLATIFKQMDKSNCYDKFENLHQQVKKVNIGERISPAANYKVDRTPHNVPNYGSSSREEEYVVEEPNLENTDDNYVIDPKCPGLLLIINNECFYTEPNPEYADKLLPIAEKLDDRTGSQADKQKLASTFRNLGFRVQIEENLTHLKISEILKKTVKEFAYTSFFVAILSHGNQGVVYGANSIPADIAEIQRIICHEKLRGIPKVLLLQSCQGNDCQKFNDDNDNDDYAVDGPKMSTPPRTTDLLTFRATIVGYGAVRHKVAGTWFIQALCKTIENHPSEHIDDICRKVIREVSGKKWGNKCMVPITESTFTKKLYLKILKNQSKHSSRG